MTITLCTVTASRHHGFVRFIRHDLDDATSEALCSKLEADGYDDVGRKEQSTLDPATAATIDRAHEKAVTCVVVVVCGIILATVLFSLAMRGLVNAMTVRLDEGIERKVDK